MNTLPHFHGKALPISSATKTFKGFFFCKSLFLIQSAEVKERPPSTEISIESSPRRRYFCGLFLWILLYKVQKKKKSYRTSMPETILPHYNAPRKGPDIFILGQRFRSSPAGNNGFSMKKLIRFRSLAICPNFLFVLYTLFVFNWSEAVNVCQPFILPQKGEKLSHDTSIIPNSSNSLNTSTKSPSLMKKTLFGKK